MARRLHNILPQITYKNNFSRIGPNPDLSDKMSLVLLDLASAGSCTDAGAPDAGRRREAQHQAVVDDAWAFQDGTWGSALTRGVTHFPDWIAIGTVSTVAEISAIDYARRTVTLATPMTWADHAKVWLFRDSNGRRVLAGSAPDIGAHERVASPEPKRPGTVVQAGRRPLSSARTPLWLALFQVIYPSASPFGVISPNSPSFIMGRRQ
jgi:hypothetical protein